MAEPLSVNPLAELSALLRQRDARIQALTEERDALQAALRRTQTLVNALVAEEPGEVDLIDFMDDVRRLLGETDG